MEAILNSYYKDNAQKLHKLVDRILLNFGGLSGMDVDDFYSLANEVFVDVIKRYDNSQPFEAFLYSCLNNRIKTEMTKRNRYKRRAERMSVSIDMPIGDDDNSTLADILASNVDIEKEILEESGDIRNEEVERYMESLSNIQRKIIEMKMQGAEVQYIMRVLGLTHKQYASYMRQAVKYEHIRFLKI